MKDRRQNPCHEVRFFNVSSREIDRTEEEHETTEDVGFGPPWKIMSYVTWFLVWVELPTWRRERISNIAIKFPYEVMHMDIEVKNCDRLHDLTPVKSD